MARQNVLFVCIHNSARSQLAEELLRKMAGDRYDAESAGLDPGELNPAVVDILKEEGINIEGKKTRAISDLLREGKRYDHVITVCDEAAAERCPVFPGRANRIHWSFPDPSEFAGNKEQKRARVRALKEEIKARLRGWVFRETASR